MKSEVAVKAEGIGKCYRLFSSGSGRLVEWVTRGKVKRHEEKWALKDVSFELKRGDALGIVGGNGAGKSTLLKVLTGTTRPTTGRFEMRGRLGSLLELGAGFHPEFSGKDNLYMNAAMLGIPRAEVKRRYEELADFAELGDYLMQPVRTYSSGMATVDSGFTVAMMSNPEILILDEVLAVGDQHFQKKCMDRIRQIRESGTTILFVSHSVYHVRQMCDAAIWIKDGQVVMNGDPVAVTDEYIDFQYALSGGQSAIAAKYGGEGAYKDLPHLSEVRLTRPGHDGEAPTFAYGEEMEVHMGWRDPKQSGPHHVGFIIYRNDDIMLFGASSKDGLGPLRGTEGTVVARLPVSMLAGEYYISGFMVEENLEHVVDQRLSWARFKVTYEGIEKGIYQPEVRWSSENGALRVMTGWPENAFGPNLAFDDTALVVKALDIGPRDRVLEVGGASNAFERANVVCDLDFGTTGQRNGSPGTFTEGTEYVEAPVEALPFPDGAFDFVICRQVLEHVVDPARAASELGRVAKRGLVEVPSRAGELLNGNPTHRWIIDREGPVLVFHPRCFVEHPFDNLFYGHLFQEPSLRERSETQYRNQFNHQVLFEGRLQVRVVQQDGPKFDYDDPVQAARSHYSFARNCLLRGADPTYAISDALLATRLLPGHPGPRLLLAAYQVRLLQLDEALETLLGLEDNASASYRRLIGLVKDGATIDLTRIPVPDPLDPKIAGAMHNDRPKVSIVIPALSEDGVRAAVESALVQDYPDVEVVVATTGGGVSGGEGLAQLEGVRRLIVERASPPQSIASLLNHALPRCTGNVIGFLIPPDRLQCHHLDRIVAGLLASGADAAHGDRLLLDGGGALAPDLVPGNPAAGGLSLSTVVMTSAAALDLGPLDAKSDVAVALWLDRLATRHRVFHVPSVTVEATSRPAGGGRVVEGALAQLRLRPLDLYREIVALHARETALARRVRELEDRLAKGGPPR